LEIGRRVGLKKIGGKTSKKLWFGEFQRDEKLRDEGKKEEERRKKERILWKGEIQKEGEGFNNFNVILENPKWIEQKLKKEKRKREEEGEREREEECEEQAKRKTGGENVVDLRDQLGANDEENKKKKKKKKRKLEEDHRKWQAEAKEGEERGGRVRN